MKRAILFGVAALAWAQGAGASGPGVSGEDLFKWGEYDSLIRILEPAALHPGPTGNHGDSLAQAKSLLFLGVAFEERLQLSPVAHQRRKYLPVFELDEGPEALVQGVRPGRHCVRVLTGAPVAQPEIRDESSQFLRTNCATREGGPTDLARLARPRRLPC